MIYVLLSFIRFAVYDLMRVDVLGWCILRWIGCPLIEGVEVVSIVVADLIACHALFEFIALVLIMHWGAATALGLSCGHVGCHGSGASIVVAGHAIFFIVN